LRFPQLPIVHGDALCSSVAAASVVAKVERDRMVRDLGRRFPAYGFEQHKGYGTPEHWQALSVNGPCPEHRLSYHGVVAGSGAHVVAGSGAHVIAGSGAPVVAGTDGAR
jgi:ribonuclease HII